SAPAGLAGRRTNSSTLSCGTVTVNVLPLKRMSESRAIDALVWSLGLIAASCHSWAAPALAKLLRLIVTCVVADGLAGSKRFLLTTTTVSAPSEERRAL